MTRHSVEAIVSALEHARFISLPDLRAMKRAADRPVDRLDLEALARLHPEDEA